jgi:hypothetical protein
MHAGIEIWESKETNGCPKKEEGPKQKKKDCQERHYLAPFRWKYLAAAKVEMKLRRA